MDAIVPAYNEESTVGQVVDTLSSSGLSVLVVDDGSADHTAAYARGAGARVLRQPNQGKAQAMRAGLEATESDPVAFFDADLVGLEPAHVARLLRAAALGYDMVCGLRDYGLFANPLGVVMPLITGERICRRWLLSAVPESCWTGYAIETAINHAVKRYGGRTAVLPMEGVTIRTKVDKGGILTGLSGHARMFSQIWSVDRCLEDDGTCER